MSSPRQYGLLPCKLQVPVQAAPPPPLLKPVHARQDRDKAVSSAVSNTTSRRLPEFVRHHPSLHLTDGMTGLPCRHTSLCDDLPEWHILPLPAFHPGQ